MDQRGEVEGRPCRFIGLGLMLTMGFGAVAVNMSYLQYQQMRCKPPPTMRR